MTFNPDRPFTRRKGLGIVASTALAAAVAGPFRTLAQTPEASPAADVVYPDGPLGEQIMWLLDTANAGPGSINMGEINSHFSVAFFDETPASEIFSTLSELQSAGITYEIDPNSIITTMDLPASNGRFVLVGSDESRTEVGISIDRETGLISALHIGPEGTLATPMASPEASPAS